MFSDSEKVTRTLISGPSEITDTFMFEGAMHWAKEGQRVIYVTPYPIESLPSKYHDGRTPTPDIFRLVRFMYLPDYKSLMRVLLIELDTFASLPSALLIDKLENYTKNNNSSSVIPNEGEVRVAKTCAVIIDAMNACSRILKKNVHVIAAVGSESVGKVLPFYFDNVWHFSVDNNDEEMFTLRKNSCPIDDKIFKFRKLEDRTVVLKQILRHRQKEEEDTKN